MQDNTNQDGFCTESRLTKSEYAHLRFHYDMEAFKIKATAVLFLIVLIFEVTLHNVLNGASPSTSNPEGDRQCECKSGNDSKGFHMIVWPLLLLMIGFIIIGFLCQYKIRHKMDQVIAH